LILSPGDRWKQIPKDLIGNLEYRKWILGRAAASKRVRDGLIDVCRHDLLFYINTFVWQRNPLKIGYEMGPFITYDFQDLAFTYGDSDTWGMLECIEDQRDLLIEKSREMGASCMICIVPDWIAKFHPHKQFLMISRSAEMVDSESPNSLFWKIDLIQRYSPEWLGGEVHRRKMYIGYSSGSDITGEASTGRAGVGGRATAAFIDEFSQIKEDYEVSQRTTDTTRCRIFNSTHLGTDTAFFEMCDKADRLGVRKLVLHWTQHPDKVAGLYKVVMTHLKREVKILDPTYHYPSDFSFVTDGMPSGGPRPGVRSPWYDDQCGRKGSTRAVAMDLDINPQGSISQFFDPMLIRSLQDTYCCDPYWKGDIDYDPVSGQPVGLTEAPGGKLSLWVRPDIKGEIPAGLYAMGADISGGTGATNSCLSVIDVITGNKVAEFADPNITPDGFATLAVAVGRLFHNARFAWESAGPGTLFGNRVVEMGYTNIFYRIDELKTVREFKADKPGWFPNQQSKRFLLEQYRMALQRRWICNRSKQALEECLKFKYNTQGKVEHDQEFGGDDPSGARENHGDRVIADALAWKMARELGSGTEKIRIAPPSDVPVLSLQWRKDWHEREDNKKDRWMEEPPQYYGEVSR
jgi:hypothetical protein